VLLLVLILVLLAFGLLVVALLSGSVLWAWVSVGVSVAAAAVLLVDWLHRRSAVRAGAQAGDAGSASGPAAPSTVPPPSLLRPPELHEHGAEPATEVLPVIRPDAPAPGTQAEADAVGLDERQGTQETVVLHAVPPSGSEEQPSGAHGGITSSGPNSSQSVTVGQDSDTTAATPEARKGGAAEADGDAEDTVTGVGSGAQPREAAEAPGHPLGAAGGSARLDLPPLGPDGAPPEEPRDAEAAGLVAPWARVKTLIAFRRGERRVEQLAAGAVRAQPQRLVTASGAAAARAATTATTAATAPTRRRQRKSIGLDHRVVRPAAAPVQDGTEAGAPPLAATNTSTRWGGAPTAVIRAPPSMPPARG
jgi:hypothetical protein